MASYRNITLLCFIVQWLLTIATAYDDVIHQEWTNFNLQFGKKYESPITESYPFKIFADNKLKIEKHNELYYKGLVTYDMKINHFGDMVSHEFKQLMTGLDVSGLQSHLEQNASHFIPPAAIKDCPTEVDWRLKGAVTEVKDQGMCGSCWAFSTTGVLEGQYFRREGHLVELSQQNLIDCSTAFGNKGCGGGNPVQSYDYIKCNNGIETETSYPYEGVQKNCRYNPKCSVARVKSYVFLERSEEDLKIAVANIGPIAVGIDANSNFQHYRSGVYYDHECSSTNLNHAVLVVGYGTDKRGGDYWLIKNSWGKLWGTEGYMKLARNKGNHCGVATFATYPLL